MIVTNSVPHIEDLLDIIESYKTISSSDFTKNPSVRGKSLKQGKCVKQVIFWLGSFNKQISDGDPPSFFRRNLLVFLSLLTLILFYSENK